MGGRKPLAMSGNAEYTTSLAHLLLCGTSGWAIKQTGEDSPWALTTFSFLLGHGLIGVLRFGHPEVSDKVRALYDQTALIAEVIPIPMINAELYLCTSYQIEYAYAHLVSSLIPLTTQFVADDNNDKVVDLIHLANVASLVFISITTESVWAAGLASLATLNHFLIRKLSERFDVPKMDMVAIGLSFFNVFAVNCLNEAKIKV